LGEFGTKLLLMPVIAGRSGWLRSTPLSMIAIALFELPPPAICQASGTSLLTQPYCSDQYGSSGGVAGNAVNSPRALRPTWATNGSSARDATFCAAFVPSVTLNSTQSNGGSPK